MKWPLSSSEDLRQCLLLKQKAGLLCLALAASASSAHPPTYTCGAYGDALSAHDGTLRWAVGVQHVQVPRSAPDNPGATDRSTTLCRHHQMIAYWGGRFWSFHSGGVQLCWSTSGLDWHPRADSSDVIRGGASRMAFNVAPTGRFLVSQANAGRSGEPGERLVREIFGPKSYGPETYNVKTNFAGPLPRMAPYSTSSSDPGDCARVMRVLARANSGCGNFTRRPQVDGTWLADRIPGADLMQPTTRYDLDDVSL